MTHSAQHRVNSVERAIKSAVTILTDARTELDRVKAELNEPDKFYVKVILGANRGYGFDPWYIFVPTSHTPLPVRGNTVKIEEGVYAGLAATIVSVESARPKGVHYFYTAKPSW